MQRERKQMLRNAETARKLREAEAGIERARLDRIKQIMQRILLREVARGFSSWRAAVAGPKVVSLHTTATVTFFFHFHDAPYVY